ncbi:MAG: cytochrome c maturation protein CcmE [Candidatus Eisenbacteria bacterium]|nr:cytochrome c maturation protein CcmE [Candidatus Eisenbacteria bacterium]
MNLKVVVALVLLAVAGAVGVSSFRKSVTPYISFREAKRSTGLVQVNGQIADKNYVIKPAEQFLQFKLRDQHGEVLPVTYHGVIPGNFDQASMVVAIGRYETDHFEAEQLLVKCPSKYQAEAERKSPAS